MTDSLPFSQDSTPKQQLKDQDTPVRRSQRLKGSTNVEVESAKMPPQPSREVPAVPQNVVAQVVRTHLTYGQAKSLACDYQAAKQVLSDHLKGHWGSGWIKKPAEQENFRL